MPDCRRHQQGLVDRKIQVREAHVCIEPARRLIHACVQGRHQRVAVRRPRHQQESAARVSRWSCWFGHGAPRPQPRRRAQVCQQACAAGDLHVGQRKQCCWSHSLRNQRCIFVVMGCAALSTTYGLQFRCVQTLRLRRWFWRAVRWC